MSASSREFKGSGLGLEELCHQIVPGADVTMLTDSARRTLVGLHRDFCSNVRILDTDVRDPLNNVWRQAAQQQIDGISDTVALLLNNQLRT